MTRRFSLSGALALLLAAAVIDVVSGCSSLVPPGLVPAGPTLPTITKEDLADERSFARMVDGSWTPAGQIGEVLTALGRQQADCAFQRENNDYQEFVCQVEDGRVLHELTFYTAKDGAVLSVSDEMGRSATKNPEEVLTAGRRMVTALAKQLVPGQEETAAEVFSTVNTKGFAEKREIGPWTWTGSIYSRSTGVSNPRYEPYWSAVIQQPERKNPLRGPAPVNVSNEDIKQWGKARGARCYSDPAFGREDCFLGEGDQTSAVATWGALDSVVEVSWPGKPADLSRNIGEMTFLREPWRTEAARWVSTQSGITGLTVIEGTVVRFSTASYDDGRSGSKLTVGHRADHG